MLPLAIVIVCSLPASAWVDRTKPPQGCLFARSSLPGWSIAWVAWFSPKRVHLYFPPGVFSGVVKRQGTNAIEFAVPVSDDMTIHFSGKEASVGLSGSIRIVGRVPKVYLQPSQVEFARCSGSALSHLDNGIYSDVRYIAESGDLVGNEFVAVGSRDGMVQIAYSAYDGEGSFPLSLDECRQKDGALMCTALVAGTRIAVKITPKAGGAFLTTVQDGTADHHKLRLIGSWQQAVSRGRILRPEE